MKQKQASVIHPLYKWADRRDLVWITVMLPSMVRNSVKIHITPEGRLHLKALRQTKTETTPCVLDLLLRSSIRVEDSTWRIKEDKVEFRIVKQQKMKWSSLQVYERGKPPNEGIDWDKASLSDDEEETDDEEEEEAKWQKAKLKKLSSNYEKWVQPLRFSWLDWLTFIFIGLHIFLCPFTKVEESFNLQAIHDLLYNTFNLEKYDHLEFPGVVPRTFLGPLMVSFFSFPTVFVLQLAHLPKILALFAVRLVLGTMSLLGLKWFREAARAKFGREVAIFFTLLVCSQFHLLFYMSRTLPNIFALIFVLVGLGCWLEERWYALTAVFAFASVVFRSELVALYLPIILRGLLKRQFSIPRMFLTGVIATLLSIVLTVAVDSVFWGRLVWPEGEVFWYNTVLNKSVNWGTSPWYWYFTSALPRGLLGAYILWPLGFLWEPRARPMAMAALAFVCLYSFLPHKELRFIIYAFPLFNLVAAVGMFKLYISKKRLYRLGFYACVCLLLVGAVFSFGFLYASSYNYPAAYALNQLHHLESPTAVAGDTIIDQGASDTPSYYVHIDTYCAMTGISRFLEMEEGTGWRYSKAENLTSLADFAPFSHLLCYAQEGKCKAFLNEPKNEKEKNINTEKAKAKEKEIGGGRGEGGSGDDEISGVQNGLVQLFEAIGSVEGYEGVSVRSWPPSLKLAPKVFILRNKQWNKKEKSETLAV